MARASYVRTLLGPLDTGVKRVLNDIFEYILGDLRVGPPSTTTRRAGNLKWFYFEATTPSSANVEFSLLHGLPQAPYVLIPCLNLRVLNARIVRLTLSRLPDTKRVYLSSPDTNAFVSFWLEA